MFVLAKRNIILPDADRGAFFQLHRDEFIDVPKQFAATPYFAALVNDGKIVVPESRKDAAVETANAAAEVKLAEKIVNQQTEQTEQPEPRDEKKRSRKTKK